MELVQSTSSSPRRRCCRLTGTSIYIYKCLVKGAQVILYLFFNVPGLRLVATLVCTLCATIVGTPARRLFEDLQKTAAHSLT